MKNPAGHPPFQPVILPKSPPKACLREGRASRMKGNRLKERCKSMIPASIQSTVRVWKTRLDFLKRHLKNSVYDYRRFSRYSTKGDLCRSAVSLQTWITADAHKLEKGLALPAPRYGSGCIVAERLVHFVETYHSEYGNHPCLEMATSVMLEYVAFQLRCGIALLLKSLNGIRSRRNRQMETVRIREARKQSPQR